MAATVGERFFLVRLALGDGLRTPMPMRAMAELLTEHSGRRYDSAMISGIETGKRRVALDEVDLFASVDPLGRGRAWLAFGDEPAAPPQAGPVYAADQVPPPIQAVPSASLKRTGGDQRR